MKKTNKSKKLKLLPTIPQLKDLLGESRALNCAVLNLLGYPKAKQHKLVELIY